MGELSHATMGAGLAPAWTIPAFLEARENNHLFISGVDALTLTHKYGTPLFVFSEPRIRANIARLQAAAKQVERPIKFCYASKANSNMAVLNVKAVSSTVVTVLSVPICASFSSVTLIAIVCAVASRLTPPFAVPPSSCTWNVKLA